VARLTPVARREQAGHVLGRELPLPHPQQRADDGAHHVAQEAVAGDVQADLAALLAQLAQVHRAHGGTRLLRGEGGEVVAPHQVARGRLHRRQVEVAEHRQQPVAVDGQAARVVAHHPQSVEVAAVQAVELRLEAGGARLEAHHGHVARQVGVERQAQLLVGDRRAGVGVRHHGERVHASVGAPGGQHAAVLAGQPRERLLEGRLHGALAGGLPLPAEEAAAVVLEGQPHAARRGGPAHSGRAAPGAAGAGRPEVGTSRSQRPSSGTSSAPTAATSR